MFSRPLDQQQPLLASASVYLLDVSLPPLLLVSDFRFALPLGVVVVSCFVLCVLSGAMYCNG
jgi:hypothetical protein